MKTGRYFFERGTTALHFAEYTQVSLYPFWRSVADSLYKFYLRASLALLPFARWRRYWAESIAAVDNDVIATI